MAGGDATGADARRPRRKLPEWLRQALQLFAFCGFAFAQPIFDLLGANATFFVAHDTTGWRLVQFTLILLFVPPLVLFVGLRLVHVVWPAADRAAMSGVVGALVALFAVPAIDRSLDLSAEVYSILVVAVAGGGGLFFYRFKGFRTFASYLSPAPVLFAALFLFASPVSGLLSSGEPGALASFGGTRTPVVVIVFDELPTGALIDEQGNLDAERYPGFAELAAGSTWYPGTTTVAPWTYLAIPAIQTGTLPPWGTLPIAASYPRSLFTMLGRSHELHVTEAVSRTCPKSLCDESANADSRNEEDDASLTKDSLIAFLHSVLPVGLEDRWLPSIGNAWAGFGDDGAVQDASELAAHDGLTEADWMDSTAAEPQSSPGVFGDFLRSIKAPARSALWYQHVLAPHLPLEFLPDGHAYPGGGFTGLQADVFKWGTDPDLLDVARQQFLLQVGYVDTLVGQAVHRLKDQGIWDDAFVAVVADHGLTFELDHQRRGVPLDDTNRNEILPVPLFVKYPGQGGGAIDRRPAQTVDLLPTIADSLGIDLPADWKFDGHSLIDEPVSEHKRIFMSIDENWRQGGERLAVKPRVEPERMARRMRRNLGSNGDEHDLYRLGAHGHLVGLAADSLASGPAPDASARLDNAESYDDVALQSRSIPSFFSASIDGLSTDDWVAIALNGTIAGLGPVYADEGSLKVAAMLDPSFMQDGVNEVALYAIRGDGQSLERVPTVS